MKHILLLLIFIPCIIYSQQDNYINLNFDKAYVICQIADLPDTIRIFTNYNQINKQQNYTELKKLKSDNYQLLYWEMKGGGIIDPTSYKYNLKIKQIDKNKVKVSFASKKKTYFIHELKNKEELCYELIRE